MFFIETRCTCNNIRKSAEDPQTWRINLLTVNLLTNEVKMLNCCL